MTTSGGVQVAKHEASIGYRPEVDGLRAVSVLAVILYHAKFAAFSGGFVGVDVFFVISGYLITSILIADHLRGRFSLVDFYDRRARRILPALFAMAAACMPFAWMWMTPAELRDFGRGLVAVVLFSSNILFWRTSGYFGSNSDENVLLHTWSLGVEEQYYLVFPLLLLVLWRYLPRRLPVVLAMLALASLVLAEWAVQRVPDAAFYLAPFRAWELLAGSLLGYAHTLDSSRRRAGGRWGPWLAALGLGAILASVFWFDEGTPFPGLSALLPTLGAVLVIAFATPDSAVGRLLSLRPMVLVGLFSYSAYLWHQPIFAFARLRSAEAPSIATTIALLLLSLLCGYLSWRYVESPFRQRARVGRRAIFTFAAAGSAALLALGLSGHFTAGFPGRLDDDRRALLATALSSPKRGECHTHGRDYLRPQAACRYFGDRVHWAVFGDSHSVEMAYALAERLQPQGEGLLHLTFSNCEPAVLFESREPGCSAWQKEALDYLAREPGITDVVVGFRVTAAMFGDQLGRYPSLPDEAPRIGDLSPEASRDLVWRSFVEIVTTLQKAGKRVHVLGPVPELDRHVAQKILAGQFKADADFDVGTTTDWYRRRNAFVLERMRRLDLAGGVLIDPALGLCDDAVCRLVQSGEAMYFDDDHLSLAGARHVLGRFPTLGGPPSMTGEPSGK